MIGLVQEGFLAWRIYWFLSQRMSPSDPPSVQIDVWGVDDDDWMMMLLDWFL